jgi:hypothetical protein
MGGMRQGFWRTRHDAPGAALLHPVSLASLLVLGLNDHVLKRVAPGVLSGKLSDFAGVVLLPLFLHAAFEVSVARFRAPPSAELSNRALTVCLALGLSAFALPEVWPAAETVYRYAFGVAYWPFRTLVAVLAERPLPSLLPVDATADVTDLLALPMGFIAYAVGRRKATQLASSSA